jgi:TusA-related sulfurtransferase
MFYNCFVTPIVHFISKADVEKWACQYGMEIVDYEPGKGNVHIFVLKKQNLAATP